MEVIKHVPVIEVKRTFVLDDIIVKNLVESEEELTIDELRERYDEARSQVEKIDEIELNRKIISNDEGGGPKRIQRYEERSWYEIWANLEDVASWPKVRSLPIHATIGNVYDIAEYIYENTGCLDKPQHINPNELKKPLESLLQNSEKLDFVRNDTHLILLNGKEVRGTDYNKWAIGKSDPTCDVLCELYEWTIDNGNVRALALALDDYDTALAYAGIPQKE